MTAALELAPEIGASSACKAMNVPRASLYRSRRPRAERLGAPRPRPARSLSTAERERVLETLNSERFADKSPAEVQTTLLDEGTYLCSLRTMYRVLEGAGQVRERRNQLRHPAYSKPELLATRPNQVWSWDITKLRGPGKWTYFALYVVLDIFSRYVVGWMVAEGESAALAEQLIADTCAKENVIPGTLKIHADRGSAMTSKSVALLCVDLGVDKTHSRPHVSDDNPYSESQFKTLKYQPSFPDRFGSIQDARRFCQDFFPWYNLEHRHSGIAMLTPYDMHYGRAQAVLEQRSVVLARAYQEHPERFVGGVPSPAAAPTEAWINRPEPRPTTQHTEPTKTQTICAPTLQ
jgi:putative transposase